LRISEEIGESKLSPFVWFFPNVEHSHRSPPEGPVNSGNLKGMENTRRGRGQPKLTWTEAVKRDLT
jgi:hypothetical protein